MSVLGMFMQSSNLIALPLSALKKRYFAITEVCVITGEDKFLGNRVI